MNHPHEKKTVDKTKVAVIAPCPFFIDRGTPIRIKRLASSLADDFSIHVITFGQGRDLAFPFAVHRTMALFLRIRRTGANVAKVLYDLLLVIKTLRVVRREKIEVIDGHLHEGAFIGLIVGAVTGARVIYNAHGTFVKELIATGAVREGAWLLRPLAWFENWVERSVDMIVAQSRLRRDEFLARGIPPEKVVVVEDVPELEAFAPEAVPLDPELERYLRPHGEKLLIYSGGMETYQGVDFLLEAFRELSRRRSDVRLVLFGTPTGRYRRLVSEMGIEGSVIFVEDQPFEALPRYLKLCDIGFALRLYGDNVPGKLPIYLASGIPVIGTDVKGISTVVTDGVNGLLVSPGDVTMLVDKIERLLRDKRLAKSLGAAGREEALRRYSEEEVRQVLGQVYRSLLGRPGATNTGTVAGKP